jgi:L-ascorbate metabolism protein UlaG (beta-lactamase superfamily)
MELQFYGANCIKLTTKKASVIFDDNLAELGAKTLVKSSDIAVMTTFGKPSPSTAAFTINFPGEYEVAGVTVWGIAARSHMDEEGGKSAVIYKVLVEDIQVAVVGHIYPDLSNEQLEALGMIDVLIVPVGGHGYTLDPVGALKIIKKIEPKIIIPTHFGDPGLDYPMPQLSLEAALKELSMEPAETTDKLKLKKDAIPPIAQLMVLNSVR